MKLFKTNDINIVKQCQREINFNIPSDVLVRCRPVKNLKIGIGSVTIFFFVNTCNYIVYVAAKATYIRLLLGQNGDFSALAP